MQQQVQATYEQINAPRVTMQDAIRNVSALADLLPNVIDDVESIEAASIPVQYQLQWDTNFEDRNAYLTGVARYIEEAHVHAAMNELLEEGKEYAVTLYTWRSCSRALPEIRSNEQPNRMEIYEKTVEILGPQIKKLLNFMYFQKKAIERFADEARRLCHARERRTESQFVSEAYLLTLGKMLNMFAVLDELKNMKASIKNDHSVYRRAAQSLRTGADQPAIVTESHNLSIFLGTQNKIRDALKFSLNSIPGFEELLADVVNTCSEMFEERHYILPSEKHMLVKVIGFSLFLMDTEAPKDTGEHKSAVNVVNINKMDKKGTISLAKFDHILKQQEVVILYGDMSIRPFEYVRKTPNFDQANWPECASATRVSNQSSVLLDQLPSIRTQHTAYISELSRVNNEFCLVTSEDRRPSPTEAQDRQLYELALRGLKLLSEWNSIVVDLYSWKLSHLTDHHLNNKCPMNAEDYERAIRYNLSGEEKSALVEVVAMIKGLQVLLLRLDSTFHDAIARFTYLQLQRFVQITLATPLRKATKNKKEIIRTILSAIRHTSADWVKYSPDQIDELLARLKKEKGSSSGSASGAAAPTASIQLNTRTAGPSSTQLYMVRTMAESLTDKTGGKKTLRKDIDIQSLAAIDTFLVGSFFWSYLLNFNASLQECCDLSQLWYREFYLEMTMGSRIQFPIEMSLPWILTDHVLEGRISSLLEYVLYSLDLYNDSAHYALTHFKRQYLYDEIEAELNLVFDQFVYKLSEQIFHDYKQLAAYIYCDKVFLAECLKLDIKIRPPLPHRYVTLMKQKHIQLLGRYVDLGSLLAQRMNANILKSLSLAIQKFESEDLTGIFELEALVEVNRLCHELLSEHLPLTDFADLWREANLTVNLPLGRVNIHIYSELTSDFFLHYCYNGSTHRFVKAPMIFAQEAKREPFKAPPQLEYLFGSKQWNSLYSSIFGLYSGFIGWPHLRLICRQLGYEGITVILREIDTLIQGHIQKKVAVFVRSLNKLIPKIMKNPKYDYGSAAVFHFYHGNLKDIISHTELRTTVFQTFREIGNMLLFSMLLEQSLMVVEVLDLKQAGPLQGVVPKPFVPAQQGAEQNPAAQKMREHEIRNLQRQLEARFAPMNAQSIISRLGNPLQAQTVNDCDLLTRERLCCGLTLFSKTLEQLRVSLLDPQCASAFTGIGALDDKGQPVTRPENGVMFVDETYEFHRLWSAIQFVYCLPVGENQYSIEQLFGEGLNWAGAAIIAVLGQHRRFDALDYSYHLLRINRVDCADQNIQGIQLKKVVDRVRRFQIINGSILSALERFLEGRTRSDTEAAATAQQVVHFQPPNLNQMPNMGFVQQQ